MTYLEEKSFFFESKAPGLGADTFVVVNFTGTEGLSRPYEMDITLMSGQPEIDLKAVLENPAALYLRPGHKLPIHGLIAKFKQLNEVDGNVFYQAILVPRLWQLTLFNVSEVYLEMTFPEILEQVLQEGGLTPSDYRLELERMNPDHALPYRTWSFVCQYQETHLNFISRWMEREGIYYFFEQGEDSETLVITDSSIIHVDLPEEKLVHFSPPSGLETLEQKQAVTRFVCEQKQLPRKVVLQDFNHRRSPPIIQGEAEVSPSGRGEVCIYGEHMKDQEQASAYARIRAEEILCGETLFHGDTTAAFLRPGFFFDLDRHYRASFNRKYLLLGIEHDGSQAALLAAGVRKGLSEKEQRPFYRNLIEAISSDVQFRPERKTPKHRFHGTINAKVEGEGEGKYAELDQFGRYKVKFPFDRSDRAGQKASRWIRMAQPFAGPNEGMHFPLRKGAEVLLTFMDGDPDRPIIAAAVPGAEGQSVVKDQNATKNLIKTSGGNKMHFEDQEGNQRILLHSPTADSWVRIGAHNDPPSPYTVSEGDNLAVFTDADGEWHLYSAGSKVASKNAALTDNNQPAVYRLTRDFNVKNNLGAYSVTDFSPAVALNGSPPASGSTITVNGVQWTLTQMPTIAPNASAAVTFYREQPVTIKVRPDVAVVRQVKGAGIRIRSSDHVWVEAENRYAEYTAGGPLLRAGVPEDLKYLWDKFYGASPAFKPSNLKLYDYGSGVANPASAADAASLKTLARKGRVRLAKGDTFNTQEGNIYDFGGYWTYNLGNSYTESHISQVPALNQKTSKLVPADTSHTATAGIIAGLLGIIPGMIAGLTVGAIAAGPAGALLGIIIGIVAGTAVGVVSGAWGSGEPGQKDVSDAIAGPGSGRIKTWAAKVKSSHPQAASFDAEGWMHTATTWVDKKFGDSYSYYKGNSISFSHGNKEEHTTGDIYSYTYGGKREEAKFNGKGIKTFYSKSAAGVKEEFSYNPINGQLIKYEYHNRASVFFDYELVLPTVPKLSISTKFPSQETTLSVSTGVKMNFEGSLSLNMNVKFSAGFSILMEGTPAWKLEFNWDQKKFKLKGPGTQFNKQAAIKADMEKLTLREKLTDISKRDLVVQQCKLVTKAAKMHVDINDIKIFT
ncbi:MAG TPA: type VI secretion system tip protein TssI/VgrG [bacterium]|nr:type VI secretion system tip protein TssI/VgrG [bacterium]